jgi:hypothetical protein
VRMPWIGTGGASNTPSRWGPVHTVSVRSVALCGSAWPVTWLAPHKRRALCVVYILHTTASLWASLWVAPHSPPAAG